MEKHDVGPQPYGFIREVATSRPKLIFVEGNKGHTAI